MKELKEIDIEVIKLSLEVIKRYENLVKENTNTIKEKSNDTEWIEFVKKMNDNTLFDIYLCKEGLERILNK